MREKVKFEEGEALYIKMLPGGHVGVKYFDGNKWVNGRIFPSPWHKIMGFFYDMDDIKAYTNVSDDQTTLKRFEEEIER